MQDTTLIYIWQNRLVLYCTLAFLIGSLKKMFPASWVAFAQNELDDQWLILTFPFSNLHCMRAARYARPWLFQSGIFNWTILRDKRQPYTLVLIHPFPFSNIDFISGLLYLENFPDKDQCQNSKFQYCLLVEVLNVRQNSLKVWFAWYQENGLLELAETGI